MGLLDKCLPACKFWHTDMPLGCLRGRCLCQNRMVFPVLAHEYTPEGPTWRIDVPKVLGAAVLWIGLFRAREGGGDENRNPSTTPFVNPCRSAFYCVSMQTGSLTFKHFWAILGPRFLTKRRHEDQEKYRFQAEGLREEQ